MQAPGHEPPPPLTPRQEEVVGLLLHSLATGQRFPTSQDLAAQLGVTPATVRAMLGALRRKGYVQGPIT